MKSIAALIVTIAVLTFGAYALTHFVSATNAAAAQLLAPPQR